MTQCSKTHSAMLSKHQSTSQTRLSWINWHLSVVARSEPKQELTDHVRNTRKQQAPSDPAELTPGTTQTKQSIIRTNYCVRVTITAGKLRGSDNPPIRPGYADESALPTIGSLKYYIIHIMKLNVYTAWTSIVVHWYLVEQHRECKTVTYC